MKRLALLSAFLALPLLLAGCNDFERTAFQTLSASKAVIDTAQADYESRTIPHNQCAFDVITKAKNVQTLGVDAMLIYEANKTAGAQSSVETVLTELPGVLTSVQGLSTGTCGGAK